MTVNGDQEDYPAARRDEGLGQQDVPVGEVVGQRARLVRQLDNTTIASTHPDS